jgi:hypothetical protein
LQLDINFFSFSRLSIFSWSIFFSRPELFFQPAAYFSFGRQISRFGFLFFFYLFFLSCIFSIINRPACASSRPHINLSFYFVFLHNRQPTEGAQAAAGVASVDAEARGAG